MLLLAMNEEHLQLLEYFVDCSVAMALQAAGPGNRLHDKDLTNKFGRLCAARKSLTTKFHFQRGRGNLVRRAAKKKVSDSESDDGSGDDVGTDSDEESDSDDE